MERTLALTGYIRTADELAYEASIGGLSFRTRFCYRTIDLHELEERHGAELLRRLYFHAVAFDLARLVSLRPDAVDFGPFRDQVSGPFLDLWHRILAGVWAQWRYENDLPGWPGPRIAGPSPRGTGAAGADRVGTVRAEVGRAGASLAPTLLFCGGGKDSLVAAKLLEEIGEPYDSFAYSHSIYGEAAYQHSLIDRLLDHCEPRRRHRLEIHDDFRASDIDLDRFGVRTVAAAETPSALFLALPIALAHGLDNLVVAHERSADSGNLVWERTGEEINHQWGKSLEAEALLGGYVSDHLLQRVRYFSLLKGVHDPVIFHSLRALPDATEAAHSCNVAKPWCGTCPKCVYVFLGCAACLEPDRVVRMFGQNLFAVEENLETFAALLGFGAHLPFECVGQAEESRLFLALAARRGWTGVAIVRFAPRLDPTTPGALAGLCGVRGHPHRIPARLAESLTAALARRAGGAHASFTRHLVPE